MTHTHTLCCFREIDLLKEQNSQLQKTVDEKLTKVAALEEELKKARECKVDSEVAQVHYFHTIHLWRIYSC